MLVARRARGRDSWSGSRRTDGAQTSAVYSFPLSSWLAPLCADFEAGPLCALLVGNADRAVSKCDPNFVE